MHSSFSSRDRAAPRAAPSAPIKSRFTLVAMSLGYGVVQLDVTIVNTALKSMGEGLGGGISTLQWIVNAYTIAFAAFILTTGALGDRLGAKRLFMTGFAVFTAASLACGLASTATVLVAARAVQGLGAAILVPNSLALLNHAHPDEKQRGRAVGIWAAGASLALTAGPFVGGALIEVAGWQSIFLVNVPIGLAGLWLTWRHVDETPLALTHALDLIGQLAAVLALAALAAAIIEAGALGWSNPWVIAAFAVAAAAAVVFVLRELWAAQPMLPLALFKSRAFSLAAGVGLIVNVAFYGLIFVLSLYFQRAAGLSPLATGLAFVPMMGAVLPANILAARIAEAFGPAATVAAGAIIAAAGCAALLGVTGATPYWATLAQLVAIGGGLGLLVPPLTSTLLGSVEMRRSGLAAGVLNATRQTGSVLGVSAFGAPLGPRHDFIAGVHDALFVSTVLMAMAAGAFALDAGRRFASTSPSRGRS